MPSPVLALEGNILYAFENPNGSSVDQLRELISERLLSDTLVFDVSETPPKAPKTQRPCKSEPAELLLHVPYLELVWAAAYGWLVLYEECIQRPMLENKYDGRIVFDSDLKVRAFTLLKWASGLKNGYSSWPHDLPSPTSNTTPKENELCSKANHIFQQSVAFMLFHEVAHVRQRHLDFMVDDPGVPDNATVIEMEREADEFAFRTLVSSDDDEKTLALKAWAVLLAPISSLHLIQSPAGVYQQKHPHLHHRLAGFLEKFNFPAGAYRDYFNFLCATVLVLGKTSNINDQNEPELFDDADQALSAELDAIDKEIREIDATLNHG